MADRRESQDLCFLGGMDQTEFIKKYAPLLISEGAIVHMDGRLLGRHSGLANFTIGQRKGIDIAFPSALYVIQKDYVKNTLIVGEKHLLGKTGLIARGINWISGKAPGRQFNAQVRIRYRATEKECVITLLTEDKISVEFDQPLGISPPVRRWLCIRGMSAWVWALSNDTIRS